MNIVSQCSQLVVNLLSKLGSERGDFNGNLFQLMQILGLLSMYFDAVVVEAKTFIQICSGHAVIL